MNSIHLLANLYQCAGDPRYLTDIDLLRRFCLETIEHAELTVVGELFHAFVGGGLTGAVVLAESHMAIHTWPEIQGVTLDVYVCNFTQDNTHKARAVLDAVMSQFSPATFVSHDVPRDRQLLYTGDGVAGGTFLRSARRVATLQHDGQALTVHESTKYGRLLLRDGWVLAAEQGGFHGAEHLIHPALTAHPQPKKVLIVGGEDGGTSQEALKHPTVQNVTLWVQDEALFDRVRAHFPATRQGVFDRPEMRLVRHSEGVPTTQPQYDLIALDQPQFAHVGGVGLPRIHGCKRQLSPLGSLVLHLGSPLDHPQRVRETFEALNSAFAVVRPYAVFIPWYGSMWLMAVCSDRLDPTHIDVHEIEARLRQRDLGELRCYTGANHHAIFALPPFMRDILGML